MSYAKLIQAFETAIAKRNQELAKAFQPGVAETRIRRMLKNAGVSGNIEPILALYAWKDGTRPDAGLSMVQATMFQNPAYIFLELDMMLSHFSGFKECAATTPQLKDIPGRYFPMFWDGSNQYLAVDLRSHEGSVVLLDMQSDDPVRPAYQSFESFLTDAIRANEQGDSLNCMRQ